MEVIVAALPGEKSRNNGIKEHKEGGMLATCVDGLNVASKMSRTHQTGSLMLLITHA